MATKKRTHKRTNGKKRHNKARKPNPFHFMKMRAAGAGPKKKHHSRRRRNPSVLSGGIGLLKNGLYALIGLVAARQLPQLALGTKNAGVMGYVANAAVAVAASAVASRTLGKEAGQAVLLGGGLYLANRIISDNFSPVGKYLSLSGLGDPMGLSGIAPGYFPLPVPTDTNGQPIIPREIDALRVAGMIPPPAPAAAAPMAGVGTGAGRFGGRW